jgi:DNA gyrase/topoisomerase IV subunit B
MDQIAYLNAGLVLTLWDKRKKSNKPQVFYHAGGLGLSMLTCFAEQSNLFLEKVSPLLEELRKQRR